MAEPAHGRIVPYTTPVMREAGAIGCRPRPARVRPWALVPRSLATPPETPKPRRVSSWDSGPFRRLTLALLPPASGPRSGDRGAIHLALDDATLGTLHE